jgi:hypothetical protein
MSFKQIYNAGVAARIVGKSARDNPYYQSENLPSDTAAAYRAWQMKAEAWERGWNDRDAQMRPEPSRRQRSPIEILAAPRPAVRETTRMGMAVSG